MSGKDDALAKKALNWATDAPCTFLADAGTQIELEVAALREHGTALLPRVCGVVKCGRSRYRHDPDASLSATADPVAGYAQAGFEAAEQMANLLLVHQTASVTSASNLTTIMTSLIESVGEALTRLLDTGARVALERSEQAQSEERLLLARDALNSVTDMASAYLARGAGSAPSDWENLARIAEEIGASDVATALRRDKPTDAVQWAARNKELVERGIRGNAANIGALSPADKQALIEFRARLVEHIKKQKKT